MKDQIFGSFMGQSANLLGQSANLLGPSRELNQLTLSKLEQLLSLQFASMREYTELNLGQLKSAAEITSPEDLKAYLGKQKDFMMTVSEKLAGDAQAMAAIGKEFAEEAQKIVMGGFAAATKGPK